MRPLVTLLLFLAGVSMSLCLDVGEREMPFDFKKLNEPFLKYLASRDFAQTGKAMEAIVDLEQVTISCIEQAQKVIQTCVKHPQACLLVKAVVPTIIAGYSIVQVLELYSNATKNDFERVVDTVRKRVQTAKDSIKDMYTETLEIIELRISFDGSKKSQVVLAQKSFLLDRQLNNTMVSLQQDEVYLNASLGLATSRIRNGYIAGAIGATAIGVVSTLFTPVTIAFGGPMLINAILYYRANEHISELAVYHLEMFIELRTCLSEALKGEDDFHKQAETFIAISSKSSLMVAKPL